MPQDLPTVAELVEAAEQEVTALRRSADGATAPRLALVAHVLRIVARELRDGPAVDAAERAGLLALLGEATGEAGSVREAGSVGDTAHLRAELADRIRTGQVDTEDPELRAHLRAVAEATLTIASPRHLDARRG